MPTDHTIVWLAQGRIRLKCGEEPARTVESKFGEGIRERALRMQQRHNWKMGGGGEKFLSSIMLWGRAPKDPAAIRVAITSVCAGANAGEVLYSLETDDMCGVLQVEGFGSEERRLWNKNDKRLDSLAMSARGNLACSIRNPFGTANIGVRLTEESGMSEVTEGDSLDTSPSWIPGEGHGLVFQSAGVARTREGHFAGLGPFSLQRLDVDSGEMTTLLEDRDHDLLQPRLLADDTLYFIRRPYQAGSGTGLLTFIKDALLFPFRLLYAIFHFLQFFSMTFTGKKLSSADGTQTKPMDLKEMTIWGNRVSAQQTSKQKDGEAADLVPKTWELVRKRPRCDEEVLAKGVLAFDVKTDGTVIYSNGSAIFLLSPDGQSIRLVADSMIERVQFLPGGPVTNKLA